MRTNAALVETLTRSPLPYYLKTCRHDSSSLRMEAQVAVGPGRTPCPLCGIADVSRSPDDDDQAFWVTCEFSGATEHYLCHNDHYLETYYEHVLAHHSSDCVENAIHEANGTGAAHDDRSARTIAPQLLQDGYVTCVCGGLTSARGCPICES
jgi:hypothetical protein